MKQEYPQTFLFESIPLCEDEKERSAIQAGRVSSDTMHLEAER